MKFPKSRPWRSEAHRRLVAALPCVACGRYGPSQCAHVNFGKGLGLKTSDALSFPACPPCHQFHDQGGSLSKQERHRLEWEYVDATRANLMQKGLWGSDVEMEYQKEILPLARVVHAETVL